MGDQILQLFVMGERVEEIVSDIYETVESLVEAKQLSPNSIPHIHIRQVGPIKGC